MRESDSGAAPHSDLTLTLTLTLTLIGDKVLVFCDDLISLSWYAKVLQCGQVYGDMRLEERQREYESFRVATRSACLVVSRVADHSIDLPEARPHPDPNWHAPASPSPRVP